MVIPKLNRKKNVAIEIKDEVLYISVNDNSICKQPIKDMADAALLGTIYGVLTRAGVLQ